MSPSEHFHAPANRAWRCGSGAGHPCGVALGAQIAVNEEEMKNEYISYYEVDVVSVPCVLDVLKWNKELVGGWGQETCVLQSLSNQNLETFTAPVVRQGQVVFIPW